MTENFDEAGRLRRVAYGPGATAGERVEAEAALRALDPAEDPHQRVETSVAVDDSTEDALKVEVDVQVAEQSLWRRRIRLGWLIPVAVGAVLLGVMGTLSVTGQIAIRADQSKTMEVTLPSIIASGPGNLVAANSWFDSPSKPEDAFPDNKILKSLGIDQNDIKPATSYDLPPRVLWIARQGTTGFCMIAFTYLNDPATVINCVSVKEFRESGLNIATPAFAAHWDGVFTLSNR